MTISIKKPKSISVTFRGFDISAAEVVRIVGLTPELFGNKGEPKRPGLKSVISLSYTIFSISLPEDSDMADNFASLIMHMGGKDNIIQLQNIIKPDFTEFNFYIPSRTSEIIQDGYLSQDCIGMLHELNATVGFNFY
ncbi:hypothetical protein ALO41_200007 [Pseudomonas amygdali pv. ulmi]|uniref:Uncharacterized protein n=1 Tax=Pseudomonas amygdali pv. ulmi TaxID=251720 RepID=A0A0Q0DXF0_PSEA0|nr:hypothetical protein [Pseudomonas amygdali]KPZ05576.1 hypothetical protein ALO41_200007 [Pseudomonas amygdali pv. ulmi]KWS15019.1 hypothetical protein AL065_03905 [Pseudomonas amygdali pv. ulmi]